jgi:hypothetical protein
MHIKVPGVTSKDEKEGENEDTSFETGNEREP